MRFGYLVLLVILLLAVQKASAVYAPNVTLMYPPDGYVTPTADNLTFSCNATDDESVYSVSLYHDMGGSFGLYDTNRTMGLSNNTDALLICGFDSSYTCLDGETGTASGPHFETSILREGVVVNETDTLHYPAAGNIGSGCGTIQMWLRTGPDFDPGGSEAYLFSAGTTNKNKIEIWNDYYDYGVLTFYFYDNLNLLSWAEVDISGWGSEEYHQVAAVWDLKDVFGTGNAIDLFIDGSNSSVSRDVNYYQSSITSDLYIGSYSDGTAQSGFLVDDLAIYNRPLTETEIANSFNKLLADHSEEIINWTVSNLTDGLYSWNCLTFDRESLSSWHSTNYTFIVDSSTPPSVVSVNTTPDDEEYIDPGVVANVTANITDLSDVSHVILMYKPPTGMTYNNDSMDYSDVTGLWENGTIVTTQDEGNWSYRFWSNDTWGNSGLSSVYTLPVEKDYSWTLTIVNSSGSVSATLGSVSGFKGSLQTLGILTINNTGDYLAGFDLSPNYEVAFNATEPFDLAAGDSTCIQVNMTMPETPNEYFVVINITSTSVPSYRTVNGTAISYIGGPYINETTEITDYPLSITQSSSANFTARVKNIGNETATNVTLNWTFPAGWSLTYGNASESMGSLSPYDSAAVTVTVHASPEAAAGAATVRINSTSVEGTGGTDFKVLSVSCNSNDGVCGEGCSYTTDDDCEAPGGSTTKTDTLKAVSFREPLMDVSAPERIELTKGSDYNFTVQVRNDVPNTNLTGITLSIEGYPENLVEEFPAEIGYVSYGTSKAFTLVISVPPYLEEKLYIANIVVRAESVYGSGSQALEHSSKIVFSVHGVGEAESLDAIEDAENALGEMANSGFSYSTLEGILQDAKNAYSNLEFDRAEELAKEVVGLKEKAFGLSSLLTSLEGDIAEAEVYMIEVTDSKKLLSLAKAAFQRGDYDRAESRLEAAVNAYQLETKNMLGFMLMVHQNWQYILMFVLALLFSSVIVRREVVKDRRKSRLQQLRDRRQSVKELLKQLQHDYYTRHGMSKAEYTARKKIYEERLRRLVSDGMRLTRKMAKGGKREKLVRAREDAEQRIRQLQREYFELGTVGKSDYLESMKATRADIAEIEREIGRLKKPGKSKGMLSLAVLMAVILVFGDSMAARAGENVTADDATAAIGEAEAVISDMEGLGFETERLNRTLENALVQFSRGEYESAITNARYVTVLRDKTVTVDSLLDEVELRIETLSSQGLDVSEARDFFSLALSEFGNENYEDAEMFLGNAQDSIDKAEREAALARAAGGNFLTPLIRSVNENRELTAFVLLAFALAASILIITRRKIKEEKRVKTLERSVKDAKNAVKDLQDSYFNRQKISRSAYESGMERHRNDIQGFMEALAAEKLKAEGKGDGKGK
jgi:hypothetical protein